MFEFQVGKQYTRASVAEAIGRPKDRLKGDWTTGYSKWAECYFVFCNVGSAGRTGHNYPNHWDGKELIWSGKSSTKIGQPEIDEITSGRTPIHLFWRARDRESFTYAGIAKAVSVEDETPVKVRWSFGEEPSSAYPVDRTPLTRGTVASSRGPKPSYGDRRAHLNDKETHVYLMSLVGPIRSMLPGLEPGLTVMKVGMSNAPERRLRELNWGFPPGSEIRWILTYTWIYPNGQEAFDAESIVLEKFRSQDYWLGGEYVIADGKSLTEVIEILNH